MPNRCDQCRFFYPNPPAERPEMISFREGQVLGGGYCRRRPPVWRESLHEEGVFPLVACDSWCGEFEARVKRDTVSTKPHAKD